jgi:predicted nucleic acid-binding protein
MAKFVDSNVVILGFIKNPRKDKILDFLQSEGIVVNTLVIVESFSKIETITKNKNIAIAMVKLFAKSHNIRICAVDINLIFDVLRLKGDMRISDLIHYKTALNNGCSHIVSYDKDFNNLIIPREEI